MSQLELTKLDPGALELKSITAVIQKRQDVVASTYYMPGIIQNFLPEASLYPSDPIWDIAPEYLLNSSFILSCILAMTSIFNSHPLSPQLLTEVFLSPPLPKFMLKP